MEIGFSPLSLRSSRPDPIEVIEEHKKFLDTENQNFRHFGSVFDMRLGCYVHAYRVMAINVEGKLYDDAISSESKINARFYNPFI